LSVCFSPDQGIRNGRSQRRCWRCSRKTKHAATDGAPLGAGADLPGQPVHGNPDSRYAHRLRPHAIRRHRDHLGRSRFRWDSKRQPRQNHNGILRPGCGWRRPEQRDTRRQRHTGGDDPIQQATGSGGCQAPSMHGGRRLVTVRTRRPPRPYRR
jgi:hypothetical protein